MNNSHYKLDKENKHIYPPRWADRFLEWFCHPDLIEDIQGDAHELFYLRLEESGKLNAGRRFVWDVIRFFKLSNIRKPSTQNVLHMDMLRSYFKVGARNILKNKLTSSINIIGLSLAIAFALTCYSFLDLQLNADKYHVNHARIFQLQNAIEREGQAELWANAPEALAPKLKEDFPNVASYARLDNAGVVMKYEEKVFSERIYFTDPDFLKIFSFDLKWGGTDALLDPSNIVLCEDIAIKYFGDENPVGEQVVMIMKNAEGIDVKESFKVGAVASKFNIRRSFDFNILVPYDRKKALGFDDPSSNWKESSRAAFILTNAPEDGQILADQLQRYISIQNEANPDWSISEFMLESLTTLSRNSYKFRASISMGGHGTGRLVLVGIAFFLLILACFNYMNIALASATQRIKEIGIRKAIGGKRNQLIFQFLAENVLLCIAALILGLVIATYLILPIFQEMMPLPLEINWKSDPQLWLFFGGLILFTAIAGGSYPAFYISKFKPSLIFSGANKFGRSGRFSKVILVIQYSIALFTMGISVAFMSNSQYLRNKDWGYDENQRIVVPAGAKYQEFRNAVIDFPSINSWAGAINPIGVSDPSIVVEHENVQYEIDQIRVGSNYLETMGVNLLEGRLFDADLSSDSINNIIVNQTFINDLGIADPIGFSFKYSDNQYYIIGVLSDFHFDDIFFKIKPIVIMQASEDDLSYFIASVQAGGINQTMDFFKNTWYKIDPDTPYEGFYQSSVFDGFMSEMKGEAQLGIVIAVFAMIISCVGLFGMTTLTISKRMKEFSIRKVLGASLFEVSGIMNREVLIVLGIAIIVATPLSYLASKSLIEHIFYYHAPITVVLSLLAALALTVTSIITIASKIYQVASSNPVDNLRTE